MPPRVTIVIPCLNEESTIANCVTEALSTLNSANLHGEVLVVDNGSMDGSLARAESAGARVVREDMRGYGAALTCGIAAATGSFVFMADADGSYDFRDIPRFIAQLEGGADLVIGCRSPSYGGQIETGAMPRLHRYLGNPVLTRAARLLHKLPVHDVCCGMRAFSRDAIVGLNLRMTGMEFAVEMLVRAQQRGLRLTELPITLRKDGRGRPSHLRTWSDGWKHLRCLIELRA